MAVALTAAGRRAESSQESALGAVYTPPALAYWVAGRLLRCLPRNKPSVVDFACGDGALLDAVSTTSSSPLELTGADINSAALESAETTLPSARFVELNAIETSLLGIDQFRKRLGVKQVGGIILNPPWGIRLKSPRTELRAAGFELAQGQFDSADLFLELALRLLDEGSAAALIVPDSLFFPDRAPLRRMLLETCTLRLIARLGEGFFPGVYRGAAVVVLHRSIPPKGHRIECLRLSPAERKAVLAGTATLAQVAARSSHEVPQSRFARSAAADFAIDQRQSDIRHVKAICRQRASWTTTLHSGRGVELSKHGEVITCEA